MRFILPLLTAALLSAAAPAPLGSLVPIGGRKLHILCTGQGAPVVLFLNGVPRFSLHFMFVQPEVAKTTRSCVYDRSGDAWSEAAPGDLSAAATLTELDAVVRHLSPNAPVILAGHSFGGLLARAYYAQHPNRVAAMVLIDSVTDSPMVPIAGTKKPLTELTPDDIRALTPMLRQRSAPPPATRIEPPFDRLPQSLQEAHLWASKQWADRNSDPVAGIPFQADLYRVIDKQSLRDLPLLVIARAKSAAGPEPWLDRQQRLANLSTKGRLVRAVGSGHDIQLDQPSTIVRGIQDMLADLRRTQ
jgi:pimeloyl-ACP methyl ester carboxylesterase